MSDNEEEAGRWLTYAEAAAVLHTSSEAVRQQARRGKWPKQIPNARGQPARVQVPPELLQEAASAVPAPANGSRLVQALEAHLADLQASLKDAAERDAGYREQIAFLQTEVEALRRQLAEAMAAQPWRLSQLLRRIRRGG